MGNTADDGSEPDERLLSYIEESQDLAPSGFHHHNVAKTPPPSAVQEALDALTAMVAEAEMADRDSFLHGRIVTVVIGEGESERKWSVHEPLLSAKSPYFRRMLNDDAAGLDMKEVTFRDIAPKLFSMFMHWLYGTTFGPSSGSRIFRFPLPDDKTHTVSDYIRLYLLGVTFEIVGVKNAAIDTVYSYFAEAHGTRCPNIYDVQLVFENTTDNSPMRRLLIAHCLFYFFNKRRPDLGRLPDTWDVVMKQDSTVSCAILEMLAEWGWVMGSNVPPMKIKNRQSFHDPIDVDEADSVKCEPLE
ncbi:hypothetical protein QBC34DRAFT_465000 [Podospora aff. communis PSN243]|uniref:BTB domain-containing protein n=1 Tax=Podospora aff. communis PSN243 TaxID=3040156 RepID=A0AAV9H2Z2_9PEZI|nr:hypothetical protein QBC34DRAFT_465000 [Podospora aff. communis PSN243]